MKKFCIIIFLSLGLHAAGYCQNFEGEVVYRNSFISKMPQITSAQLEAMIGSRQQYFIKEASYKSLLNGSAIVMQLFDGATNKIYNKTSRSDTLYWFDATTNSDTVTGFEVKKSDEKILGNVCEMIILKTVTGTTTLYFNKNMCYKHGQVYLTSN